MRRSRPLWGRTIEFWSAQPKTRTVSRKEMFAGLGVRHENKPVVLDGYRLYLCRAGYLLHAGVGLYRRVGRIPARLTVEEARDRAYPGRAEKRESNKRG
jgi:hypothetical protein